MTTLKVRWLLVASIFMLLTVFVAPYTRVAADPMFTIGPHYMHNASGIVIPDQSLFIVGYRLSTTYTVDIGGDNSLYNATFVMNGTITWGAPNYREWDVMVDSDRSKLTAPCGSLWLFDGGMGVDYVVRLVMHNYDVRVETYTCGSGAQIFTEHPLFRISGNVISLFFRQVSIGNVNPFGYTFVTREYTSPTYRLTDSNLVMTDIGPNTGYDVFGLEAP